MFRRSVLYQLAALTFITATYTSAHSEAVLNPTGMLFRFHRDHYGSIPAYVSGNSPQPKPKDPPGGEQPVVNARSDTFPLDVDQLSELPANPTFPPFSVNTNELAVK